MKSNWFLYGPFPFEASAVAGSTRTALAHLVEQYQSAERWQRLHHPAAQPDQPGRTDARKAGIYLLMHTDEGVPPMRVRRGKSPALLTEKPQLAGFWVVFSHTYLGEGVVGPPDKEPPYAKGILDACTEEVWWKNLEVYPGGHGVWKPGLIFEWPSELAFRSTLPPPGLPLSPDEIADPDGEDKVSGDWLERLDDEVLREERVRAEAVRQDNPWLELPQHRSQMMLIQGFLNKRRVSHEGNFRMVHPEWLGSVESVQTQPLDSWLEQLFSEVAPEHTEQEQHYLGQPLELPAGRVGFPISGWLTRGLTLWPAMPTDIRRGILSPRDIGSKLVAQLKQAGAVTALVLLLLVGMSWVVYFLTKPPVVAVIEPPPPLPEPAMSVCSADHAKFMDEFRCQIESLVYGPGTDQPVCGDSGSKELVRTTTFDLQAEYCGLKDRELDGWVWPRDAKEGDTKFNFGYVAATKACFNVLGYPYNYKLSSNQSSSSRTELPSPSLFLNHPDLAIRGLQTLVRQLDSACDAYRERMEYQVEGAVFATHVGTTPQSSGQSEAGALRQFLSEKVMRGVKSDLRQCFNTGLSEGQTSPRRLGELCGFASDVDPTTGKSPRNDIYEQRKIWQELYGGGSVRQIQDGTGTFRPLTSVVERYDFSRYGNPLLPSRTSRTTALWQCHDKLTSDPAGRLNTAFVPTTWNLAVPVPSAYAREGAGVKTQLSLDAALRAFASDDGTAAANAGPCWKVTSRRLSKYQPVHPLLREPDVAGWPTDEQQVCGQICAARYRVASTLAGQSWVTPSMDLKMCVTDENPTALAVKSHIRTINSINPESDSAASRYEKARAALLLKIDSLFREAESSGEAAAFRTARKSLIRQGNTFDRLLLPWNSRADRTLDRVSRAFSSAVMQRSAEGCEQIMLNDSLFLPTSINARGTVSEICRENYRRLDHNDRMLCDRYRELVPRYEALRKECRLAVSTNLSETLSRTELDRYLDARVLAGESWLDPTDDQICAFNLIAQGYLHDADDRFLLNGLAPPAWAGETTLGSRIAGGGQGAKEATGVVYLSTDNLSRIGKANSLNTCSYVASQCFAEKLMKVMGEADIKPYDWKEEWRRLIEGEIYQIDRAEANRLREASPWCGLIQPYTNLEEGDIDYPCAKGVDDARISVERTIDFLAAEIGTEG